MELLYSCYIESGNTLNFPLYKTTICLKFRIAEKKYSLGFASCEEKLFGSDSN